MNVKLVVIGGKQAGMEIPVEEPMFRIGRGGDCHFQPESKLVSRLHCLISVDDGSVAIEDCGSAMGTFVNGEKVHLRHELNNGDRIKIDTLELEVQLTTDENGKKKPADKSREFAGAYAGEWGGGAGSRPWEDAEAEDSSKTAAEEDRRAKRSRLPREPVELDRSDLLLMGVSGVLLLVVLSLFLPAIPGLDLLSTRGWCVAGLNALYRSPWGWIGFGVAMVEILLAFHYWPVATEFGLNETVRLLQWVSIGILPLVFVGGLALYTSESWVPFTLQVAKLWDAGWVRWGVMGGFAALLVVSLLFRVRTQQ